MACDSEGKLEVHCLIYRHSAIKVISQLKIFVGNCGNDVTTEFSVGNVLLLNSFSM